MIEGVSVGEPFLVLKLLKGCYNNNPPRAKYYNTWDSNQVLCYNVSLGESPFLPLPKLASKMMTLVVLATLMRVSENASIGYDSEVFSETASNSQLKHQEKRNIVGRYNPFHYQCA